MLRLAVDASALVAELLRRRGRELLKHTELELVIAEPTWSEVEHEFEQRLLTIERQGRLGPERRVQILAEGLALADQYIARVPEADYKRFEPTARSRIPRDPNDWPTVAVAMLLDAAIWTHDYDFFGCGLPTWTTETLLVHLKN